MWSTGEGNGKPLHCSCPENPMNGMKRQKDRTLKDELPRSVGAQYAAGDQWRNNFRKNEGMEPKQKQHPVVDVTGDRSNIQFCKEQYCIGTWNVRSMENSLLPLLSSCLGDDRSFGRGCVLRNVHVVQDKLPGVRAGLQPLLQPPWALSILY